jgi:hypothetical protein
MILEREALHLAHPPVVGLGPDIVRQVHGEPLQRRRLGPKLPIGGVKDGMLSSA